MAPCHVLGRATRCVTVKHRGLREVGWRPLVSWDEPAAAGHLACLVVHSPADCHFTGPAFSLVT